LTPQILGRIIANTDTAVFTPESSFVQILSDSADADTTIIMIQKSWGDGDTVWFMLDSEFFPRKLQNMVVIILSCVLSGSKYSLNKKDKM